MCITEGSIVAVSETCAPSKKSASRVGIADKPLNDACFNDWKRFCFALREIASGDNGRALSGLEAQERAQAVLTECGYTWLGGAQVREPIIAPTAASERLNSQAPVDLQQTAAGTKLKNGGKAQSPPGRRRGGPHLVEHRIGASTNSSPT